MKKTLLGIAVFLCVLLAIVLFSNSPQLSTTTVETSSPENVKTNPNKDVNSKRRKSLAKNALSTKSIAAARASKNMARNAKTRKDRALAEMIRKTISNAATATKTNAQQDQPTANAESQGSLDKDYILSAIKDIMPLLKECIPIAKADGTTDIDGKLVVKFEVNADSELGGVIGGSEVLDGSTIESESLRECVRETMYSVVLPAPEGGGKITVKYPFQFSEPSPTADPESP